MCLMLVESLCAQHVRTLPPTPASVTCSTSVIPRPFQLSLGMRLIIAEQAADIWARRLSYKELDLVHNQTRSRCQGSISTAGKQTLGERTLTGYELVRTDMRVCTGVKSINLMWVHEHRSTVSPHCGGSVYIL